MRTIYDVGSIGIFPNFFRFVGREDYESPYRAIDIERKGLRLFINDIENVEDVGYHGERMSNIKLKDGVNCDIDDNQIKCKQDFEYIVDLGYDLKR
jgi:hypothetical protein